MRHPPTPVIGEWRSDKRGGPGRHSPGPFLLHHQPEGHRWWTYTAACRSEQEVLEYAPFVVEREDR